MAEGETACGDCGHLPIWDRDAFDGFTDWMPSHRIEKLLELFRVRTRVAIDALPDAAGVESWEKESHDLIYSAGTLGFVRLAEACRRMQAAIRRGDTPTDQDRGVLLDALATAYEASDIGDAIPSPK